MRECRIKEKLNIENVLCFYIIISPILDIISFVFRNNFKTNLSPSTFLRPIIPMALMIYVFFKRDKKFKITTIFICLLYFLYAIIHLLLFYKIRTLSSYGSVVHEAQYLLNYSFMILTLFLYIYLLKGVNQIKIKKSILFAVTIYILSIYISIITKTSSYTYIEKMGYKGWFESGNSLCAILTLSMYIFLPLFKEKKYMIWVAIVTLLVQIFLMVLVGTRVGFFGFILGLGFYIFTEIINKFIKNKKVDKKSIVAGILIIIGILVIVAIFGSTTLQRRKHLKDIESDIIDTSINSESHITGSLLEIKNKIDNNTLEDGFMDEEEKKSVIDLYNLANKLKIANNDQRTQQLIYNIALVKNQSSIILILFGNGYMNNYRELVCEMEVPAILLNFGLLGFCLYLGPFIAIVGYVIYKVLKKRYKISADIARYTIGCMYAFALSIFSGYTFFSQSTVLFIIILSTLVLNSLNNNEIT